MNSISSAARTTMKSPADLGRRLVRQWQQARLRLARLLVVGSWPQDFPIGKPSARAFADNVQAVQRHVQAWRAVRVGKVEWASVRYRAGDMPITLPVCWRLHNPSEWVEAANDASVRREYAQLEQLIAQVDGAFHSLLVAQRGLWLTKPLVDVIATAQLATQLTPGCARGRPLRLLGEFGVDTKFFERNVGLLTKLLDERYEGEVSEQGLTTFLDAFEEKGHWVLVVPLWPGLLPFKQLRLTTAELSETDLPGSRLLIVENEQCSYLLPALPDTLAILGAGLDLQWLASPRLTGKRLAYWGDMDTWGLLMLGRARVHQPGITALLMARELFDEYAPVSAVVEPVTATAVAPESLLPDETTFYRYLLETERGRLEQEYLAREAVKWAIETWAKEPIAHSAGEPPGSDIKWS
jgi:hypothetical protein